jgi:hypothetical protein
MTQDRRWTEKSIQDTKARIKAELDTVERDQGAKAKAQFITDRIRALEATEDSGELLDLYVYLVSSLVHHIRFQHVNDQRIKKTLHLAHTILLSRGIREKVSRLSFLHGELHIITSQIERAKGHHWSAAWYQYLGDYVSRGETPGGDGFQSLSMANRSLRLGYAELAFDGLKAAEQQLTGSLLAKCLINQVRALRLASDYAGALALIRDIRARDVVSDSLAMELDWEETIDQVRRNQDPSLFLSTTRKGQTHYHASYLIETSLWLMAMPARSWLERLPNLENLKRRKDLNVKRDDQFFILAKTIQQGYDYEIPLGTRLKQLGQQLTQVNRLVNIDKELLCWAAASRFLTRSRCQSLAQLALQTYRSHCLTLSQGQSRDVLKVFTDME